VRKEEEEEEEKGKDFQHVEKVELDDGVNQMTTQSKMMLLIIMTATTTKKNSKYSAEMIVATTIKRHQNKDLLLASLASSIISMHWGLNMGFASCMCVRMQDVGVTRPSDCTPPHIRLFLVVLRR
jgi:hypothetical protein